MENLISRLETEVGLTSEQAIKTVSVIKDFMDKEGLDINWEKFFKGKYDGLKDDMKSLYDNMTEKSSNYADKLADAADDFADQAKKTAHDLSKKVSDFFDDTKKP